MQFLREREAEFPGVAVVDTFIRRYPFGDLAPQLLGHVGEISPEQLKGQRAYLAGDRVGQGGRRGRLRQVPARTDGPGPLASRLARTADERGLEPKPTRSRATASS